MKHILRILLAVVLVLAACTPRSSRNNAYPVTTNGYIVAAYVWPSCHDDSLAHAYLWGDGEGEWEVIKKGNPRFPGHYQPKQPLWGYEMDNDPKVVERWIDTAVRHGVNTFVYDWYWFMDYPYLESALNDGFLGARNNRKMNFYIMWANHTVVHNYWNYHRWGEDRSVLFSPTVDWNAFKVVVHRVISQYFSRPNYLKIDGCPVFGLFSATELKKGFGTWAETAKAIAYFREEVRKAGFPDLHLQFNYGGGFLPSKDRTGRPYAEIDSLGANSVAFYNMGGFDCDYMTHGRRAEEIRAQWDSLVDVTLFPTVSIGWDDTPRFPEKGENQVTRWHNTPESFAGFLTAAKEYADNHPDQPKIVYINAWNEWVEGSYLLPDKLNGFGYLEAVRKVFMED